MNASVKIALSKSEPFAFASFYSCLPLRFNISYLPTFFPKQVYLYGVLRKNSVNRCWVAMAPLHRKRPRQFVSSYSLKGLQSWVALFCFCLRACIPGTLSAYGLGALGRLVIQCYTLFFPHLHVAWCASTAPSSTGQAETRNNDQAKRETSCSKHPPAAPAQRREQEEGKSTNQRYQRATKEGQGRVKDQESKPGKTRSKTPLTELLTTMASP